MSEDDRTHWETKHAQAAGERARPLASLAWLPCAAQDGLALDLACGRGRHCRPLVDLGYRVVAVDIAANALRRLYGEYARTEVVAVQADLDTWPFAAAVFDLVLQTDFLDRRLFRSLKASVRSGGLALVDTFCGDWAGMGPRCGDYRLAPGELRAVFADWEIVRSEAYAPGREATLARKP
jgi:SAM-dependent methyltransferase